MSRTGTEPLLAIQGLRVGFVDRAGAVRQILRGVDLSLTPGASVGLVGESGSGKSTLALAAMAYLKPGLKRLDGSVRLEGRELFELPPEELQRVRGGVIGLVPQNAGQALTPTMRIGQQIEESLRLHAGLERGGWRRRVVELLDQVRLPRPESLVTRYPHELSGGQQQRVAIAMALAGGPRVLLLDEPTTGLDVTTQAHILELLRDINRQTGTAMVYVSHDLGAIARVCERVSVLYAGELVLEGDARAVLRRPAHPYPRGLLASIPRLSDARLPSALPGLPPSPGQALDGCAFAPRCEHADAVCFGVHPNLQAWNEGAVRCHHAGRIAVADGARPQGGHDEATPGPHLRGTDLQNDKAKEGRGPSLLSVHALAVRYDRPTLWQQLIGNQPATPLTLDDIDLALNAGETLALVGESGSGKSSVLKVVAGLLTPARGRIEMEGAGVLGGLTEHRSPDSLRRIQLIFQNPDDSLNPRHEVATILAQPLKLYFGLQGEALRRRSIELLEQVRLGAHCMDRLPAQLSGGEKQRVAIARAFAAEPAVLLCDEVTSALDVSVQAAVLSLLRALQRQQGVACLMVSHDLAVVRTLADHVAVLYQGRLCEVGPVHAVYAEPHHPYTEVLLGAVLEPDPDHAPQLLARDVAESLPPARGCAFQRRCPRRLGSICDDQDPPWQQGTQSGHRIRCHIPLTSTAHA